MADIKPKNKANDEIKSKTLSKSINVPKVKSNAKPTATGSGVNFRCRLCEKQKPISEMKIIKRFRPVIFVCQDCEKTF
jgi:hypothetical protein